MLSPFAYSIMAYILTMASNTVGLSCAWLAIYHFIFIRLIFGTQSASAKEFDVAYAAVTLLFAVIGMLHCYYHKFHGWLHLTPNMCNMSDKPALIQFYRFIYGIVICAMYSACTLPFEFIPIIGVGALISIICFIAVTVFIWLVASYNDDTSSTYPSNWFLVRKIFYASKDKKDHSLNIALMIGCICIANTVIYMLFIMVTNIQPVFISMISFAAIFITLVIFNVVRLAIGKDKEKLDTI